MGWRGAGGQAGTPSLAGLPQLGEEAVQPLRHGHLAQEQEGTVVSVCSPGGDCSPVSVHCCSSTVEPCWLCSGHRGRAGFPGVYQWCLASGGHTGYGCGSWSRR